MEYKILKKIIPDLDFIFRNKTNISDMRKNLIIDMFEIVKDILYNVNDVITIYNDSPNILWINQGCYKVYGFTPEEIIKNGYNFIVQRIHPDDLQIIEKRNELFIKGIEYTDIVRVKHKDGYYVWVKQTGKVFKSKPDGTPFLFLGVSTDITEIANAKDTIDHLANENKKLSKLLVDCKISSRELEILKLIAEGYPGKQIGDMLNISFNTVRTHRNNIMRKLNINCTAGLVNYYREKIKGLNN